VEGVQVSTPNHNIQLAIAEGEFKGRKLWPWAHDLNTIEGIGDSAGTIKKVMGDKANLPVNGDDLQAATYLEDFEEYAGQIIGEVVEVAVQHSDKMDKNGSPKLKVYINRGLGKDAAAAIKAGSSAGGSGTNQIDPNDNLNMGPPSTTKPPKKKAAKKKKKAVKKKKKKVAGSSV